MLTKLLPDQIAKFWDVISYALDQSPPITLANPEDWKSRILTSVLSGRASVWASYDKSGKGTVLEGIVFTSILTDSLVMVNSLLIYYLYGYTKIPLESYKNGLMTLAKYAKSKNCHNILAYTNDDRIIEIVTQLGADASVRLITFDIQRCLNNLINYIGE